jgi:hypothetical protein
VNGRHRSLSIAGAGSATRSRHRFRPLLALAVAVALTLAGWVGYSYGANRERGARCGTPLTVTVAAAPEIAPVLTRIAGELTPQQRTSGSTCYLFQVSGLEPSRVAAALTGIGTAPTADVWVPDSTYWLREASAVNIDVPGQGQSIASSPTVLAMPEPVARRFGWPEHTPSWPAAVAAAAAQRSPLPVGTADPGSSPLGLFGLLGVRDVVQHKAQAGTQRVVAFRAFSKKVFAPSVDLLNEIRQAGGVPDGLSAAPVSEQSVVQYLRSRPPVPVVAAYPGPAVPGLDYPYIVLPGVPDPVRAGAQRFLGAILSADPAELAARGFRTPQGTTGPGFTTATGIDTRPVRPVRMPDQARLDGLLTEWAGVNRSGRLVVAIDISGSMNETVPGTDKTRIELTKQTAQAGLALFKPTTEVGLWVFSTNLDGRKDYRELLPIEPMYLSRAQATAVIGQIQAKPNGSTGLYDTVLAGYQKLRAGWNPARINALVVLTDGQNEDPNGISRATLLRRLRALANPRKPLQIVFIGLGRDVNPAELNQIAAVTGGQAFITPDPRGIGSILVQALSAMTCAGADCGK